MPAHRPTKITFGEMREMGIRGLLVDCADYRCSHTQLRSAVMPGPPLLFSAIGCNRMQEENSGAQKNKDYHRTQSHRRTRHLRRVQVSGETQFGVWAAS
jgi:hypothetical protein